MTSPVSGQVAFESRLCSGWRRQQRAGPPCPWGSGQPDLSPEVSAAVGTQRLFSALSSAAAVEIRSVPLPRPWVPAPHTTFFTVFV